MPDTAGPNVPDLGLFRRITGVIFSPGRTFATVAAYPRPATILLVVCLILGVATALPQFTEHGRQQMLEAQVRQIERTGQTISPDLYASYERMSHYAAYTAFGSMFITVPVLSLLIAGVFWGVFNAILGGLATFKQVLGIVTHAQVIGALGVVVSAPIIWFRGIESFAGPFNLGALAPMLDPASPVAGFLSNISFFTLWQIVVTAIGLGVLYKRRPAGIAVACIAAYLLLVAGLTAIFSAMVNR
jgi:hypothetical protein